MGRGLVIGTNRLFAAAEFLLSAESRGELRSSLTTAAVRGSGGSPRQGAPTQPEVDEAWAMLVRMGFLQRRSERPPAS